MYYSMISIQCYYLVSLNFYPKNLILIFYKISPNLFLVKRETVFYPNIGTKLYENSGIRRAISSDNLEELDKW